MLEIRYNIQPDSDRYGFFSFAAYGLRLPFNFEKSYAALIFHPFDNFQPHVECPEVTHPCYAFYEPKDFLPISYYPLAFSYPSFQYPKKAVIPILQ